MTKTIEIVEREIKFLEEQIVKYEIHLFAFPQLNVENRLEEMKEDLQTLKQIKRELEAWEIVADKIFYGVGRCLIDSSVWFREEAETLKKALEVEDE